MKWTIGLLLSVTLSSGCVMTGNADGCAGWKPIRLEAATIDAMTEAEARDVLAHNEFGRELGCW